MTRDPPLHHPLRPSHPLVKSNSANDEGTDADSLCLKKTPWLQTHQRETEQAPAAEGHLGRFAFEQQKVDHSRSFVLLNKNRESVVILLFFGHALESADLGSLLRRWCNGNPWCFWSSAPGEYSLIKTVKVWSIKVVLKWKDRQHYASRCEIVWKYPDYYYQKCSKLLRNVE